MNFYDFYEKLQGEPYSDERTPPPVPYKFADYRDQISSSNSFNDESGDYSLRPLDVDDMARYATKDVEDHLNTLKKTGWNPTKLGSQMSDEEFQKHYGIPKFEEWVALHEKKMSGNGGGNGSNGNGNGSNGNGNGSNGEKTDANDVARHRFGVFAGVCPCKKCKCKKGEKCKCKIDS
jgi:hypothetical protein